MSRYCLFLLVQIDEFSSSSHLLTPLFLTSLPSYSSQPMVSVYTDPSIVGKVLCDEIAACARKSITEKGNFYLAVPGGSVLKLLSGLTTSAMDVDWSKVFLFYVNHKCVPMTDATATHLKAKTLFLDALKVPQKNVADLSSDNKDTKGHDSDAHNYEKKLKSCGIPISKANNLPIFDFMLIGMGKDGHIGSLYPNRNEVLQTDKWVLTVDKKTPASITLSLPIMNNAIETRIVLMVLLERFLQYFSFDYLLGLSSFTLRLHSFTQGADKAEAALIGITKSKTPTDFPVCGIKSDGTVW
jgi:6-phosphogluconolactonase/glucosamine-6-phosphate isomerase/deaminase